MHVKSITISTACMGMLWLVLLLPSLKVQAQPNYEVADANISIVTDSLGNTTASCVVIMQDTVNISRIKVKLGNELGEGDIFSETFDFDITSGLPAGMSYQREGTKVTLGLGTFTPLTSFYGEVSMKGSTGTWGPTFQFISN